ncbi:uncharacterized protein LOC135120067 [Zophobas morio]|uniref:uncharacterized protein LOC135120067 n=1 Tax=Zophobas morio TaxID=2755281 RepID=UPI0030838FE0
MRGGVPLSPIRRLGLLAIPVKRSKKDFNKSATDRATSKIQNRSPLSFSPSHPHSVLTQQTPLTLFPSFRSPLSAFTSTKQNYSKRTVQSPENSSTKSFRSDLNLSPNYSTPPGTWRNYSTTKRKSSNSFGYGGRDRRAFVGTNNQRTPLCGNSPRFKTPTRSDRSTSYFKPSMLEDPWSSLKSRAFNSDSFSSDNLEGSSDVNSSLDYSFGGNPEEIDLFD